MRKYSALFGLIAIICAIAAQAYATEGITITRTFDGDVSPGEVFEVKLTIDIDENNVPKTYVLAERVPGNFEIVDTDAKTTTEDNVMKWVEIDGLLGSVEDTEHTYKIKAPEIPGEYELGGIATLMNNTKAEVIGDNKIIVSADGTEGNEATGESIGANSTTGYGLIAAGAIAVLVLGYIGYKKFSNNKAETTKINEQKDEGDKTDIGAEM